MKTFKLVTLGLALASALTHSAKAVSLTGSIALGGGFVVLDSSNLATATKVNSWTAATVSSVDGSLALLTAATNAVSFTTPWNFNSAAVTPLYTTGGLTFNLISSSVYFQSPVFLAITGTGTFEGAGYDATIGSFAFTTQEPNSGPAKFSWSASGAPRVPDEGHTAILLGMGLIGLAALRRRS